MITENYRDILMVSNRLFVLALCFAVSGCTEVVYVDQPYYGTRTYWENPAYWDGPVYNIPYGEYSTSSPGERYEMVEQERQRERN
jgi:hypothetical protein